MRTCMRHCCMHVRAGTVSCTGDRTFPVQPGLRTRPYVHEGSSAPEALLRREVIADSAGLLPLPLLGRRGRPQPCAGLRGLFCLSAALLVRWPRADFAGLP